MMDRDALEAVAEAAARGSLLEFDPGQRRGFDGRWVRSLGATQWSRAVRVDSPLYGKDMYGYVQTVLPGGHLQVRVEDPGQTHPAVKDMLADFPDVPYDHHEFIDTVPHHSVRDAETGRTLPDPIRVIAAMDLAKQERERRAARDERVAKIRQELRTGQRASAFPELASGRRSGPSPKASRTWRYPDGS